MCEKKFRWSICFCMSVCRLPNDPFDFNWMNEGWNETANWCYSLYIKKLFAYVHLSKYHIESNEPSFGRFKMDSFQSIGRQFEMSMPPMWSQSIFKLLTVVVVVARANANFKCTSSKTQKLNSQLNPLYLLL